MNNQPSFETNTSSEDSTFTIKEIAYLCLAHWQWFVISLAVCLGVAVIYLLRTPLTYQRTASFLVKNDSKSRTSSGDVSSMFSEMGFSGGQNNVYNELYVILSPATLLEAGKRLNCDVEYYISGTFHKEALYGKTLPIKVIFHDLEPYQTAAFTVTPMGNNKYELTDIAASAPQDTTGAGLFGGRKAKPASSNKPITGEYNKQIKTPIGRITIAPATCFAGFASGSKPVFVRRMSLNSMAGIIKSRLTGDITDKKSTTIELAYKDILPQRAEDILNMIITVYKESWIEDKNLITVATSNFITERLGVIERELGDVDENISSYKSSHLLPDVEAASNLYMQQSKDNATKILQFSTQRSICNYVKRYLTEESKKNQVLPVNSGIENGAIDGQIGEYNTILLQRNSLVSNSSENNPLVQDLDRNLASQRSVILSSINNLIMSIDTQISHLEQSESRTTSQIASNPNQAKYLQSVGRQQKVKEALYLFLLQKREENELSQAFTAYNTRVISEPSGNLSPVAPRRNVILLIAFAIGLAIPLAFIYFREATNTKVRGRKDLDELNVPFLGEIPQYRGKSKHRWWQVKRPAEQRRVVVKPGKRDVINEAFRVLRTNIEFVSQNNPGNANVILMTSFNMGSGKSFLSINIAKSFAIREQKVLVIDGDLRHGSASEYVDSPEKGLTDYLCGKVTDLNEIIVTDQNVEGMNVLPMGTMPPNPTELLYSERLAAMFDTLRKQYDYIFIDCPPVEIVADAQILEQYADRVIFVVRSGLLERSMVKELQKLYDDKKHKNMSIILNGTEDNGGHYYSKYGYYRYGYGYGYGYGYHYGGKKSKKRGGGGKWLAVN